MISKLRQKEAIYFQDEALILYHGDCLDILPNIKNVDVIFADPPYFLSNGGITCHSGRMTSVNKGEWDQTIGLQDIHRFNKKWLRACKKSLKGDGTIWISGTHHIIYSIGFALQELGFKIINSITWFKSNAPPNISCRYFTHSTETIIWAAKSNESKHYFDYTLMKKLAGGKQMRDVWEITSPVKQEKHFGKHPTQKPLALLERIILASSKPGDLIVDPFAGSSTTGIAAVKHDRRFIGIDTEKKFLDVSIKRYELAIKQGKLI